LRSKIVSQKLHNSATALRDDKTMAWLCREFELAPQKIMHRNHQSLEGTGHVFGSDRDKTKMVDLVQLQAKID
jgi:transposase